MEQGRWAAVACTVDVNSHGDVVEGFRLESKLFHTGSEGVMGRSTVQERNRRLVDLIIILTLGYCLGRQKILNSSSQDRLRGRLTLLEQLPHLIISYCIRRRDTGGYGLAQ
jgi:hypothetical protein